MYNISGLDAELSESAYAKIVDICHNLRTFRFGNLDGIKDEAALNSLLNLGKTILYNCQSSLQYLELYPIQHKAYGEDVHEYIIEILYLDFPSLVKLDLGFNWLCNVDQFREVCSTIQGQEYYTQLHTLVLPLPNHNLIKSEVSDEQIELMQTVLGNAPALKYTEFLFKELMLAEKERWLAMRELGSRTRQIVDALSRTECLKHLKVIKVENETVLDSADQFDLLLDCLAKSHMLEKVYLIDKKFSSD